MCVYVCVCVSVCVSVCVCVCVCVQVEQEALAFQISRAGLLYRTAHPAAVNALASDLAKFVCSAFKKVQKIASAALARAVTGYRRCAGAVRTHDTRHTTRTRTRTRTPCLPTPRRSPDLPLAREPDRVARPPDE